MNTLRILGLIVMLASLLPARAAVKVVTATTDFAAIVREIGGARVKVESLSRGDQDLHRVEPRPSFVTRLAAADMVVRIGMDLDLWMDALLAAARNADIREGGKGYVDASAGITALEVPSGKVDASKGDIHVFGNPHYWLDPENGKIIARGITQGLKRVDPAGAATYQENYTRFVKAADAHLQAWQAQMASLVGTRVVTYHTTWSYFNKRLGLVLAGTVEAKPGIPPSAAYLNQLIATMKRDKVKVIMTTAYYPTRFTDLLARETGAKVLVLPSSVGGVKGADDYWSVFANTIEQLRAAH